MKKSKKIPKTHLPKYSGGGTKSTTLSNGNEVSMYGTGPTQGTDATSNLYNEKRKSGLTADQYAQYGQIALNTGSQLSANQSLHGEAKSQADYNTVTGGVDAVMGAATPWYGYAKGASNMGKSMLTKDQYGNYASGTDKAGNEIMTADHEHMTKDITDGNYVALGLDSMGIGKFGRMISQLSGNDQKTSGFWGEANRALNIKQDKTEFAHGGINMQPNAEVEKQENTLNPDGTTTQFNGSSHEQGGIKTNLDPGTLIFSDKLKQNGKTFADLNKPNMTHKEDKILSDSKASTMSKITANLMKEAKNKSSIKLFESQESLKQSRVDNYIKRLGGVQKYPNGGITPEQYKQAQSDSLTLYNAGLKSNKIPYYEQPNVIPAMQRLQDVNSTPGKIVAPEAIKGQAYGNQPNYTGGYNVEFKKPTMIPYRETTLDNPAKVPVVNHPNYTSYIPGIEKSKQPVMVQQFSKGGQLPKFEEGDMFGYKPTSKVEQMKMQQALLNSQNKPTSSSSWITPEMMQASSDQLIEEGYTPSNKVSKSTNTPTTSLGSKTDQELYNAELASMTSNQNGNKTDWKNIGTQAAYFAANNAGNLYDLFNRHKTEDRKYDRVKANLLDPTMDLYDTQMQNNRAEYNVRGASGGNAGTYLSNRVALNAQNTMNKSRIYQAYENANAGIKNETNKINTGIANEEILANAKIRANQRNIKQSAIASMGSNTANQMNDVRNTNMDQKRIDNLVKMYPSLSKDPEMLKYLMSFK